MRSSGPSENVGELHSQNCAHVHAHLKSRNPGVLPVRPYTYRVFAAESSRSSNIPTFLAAAVSSCARAAVCALSLSLSLSARARARVVSSDTLCATAVGHSALCAHALLKCQKLSTGLWWVGWCAAPQLQPPQCALRHTKIKTTYTQKKNAVWSIPLRRVLWFISQ